MTKIILYAPISHDDIKKLVGIVSARLNSSYTINVKNEETPENLKSRWIDNEYFKKIKEDLVLYINGEGSPPSNIPEIECTASNSKSPLSFRDFRGIDLSNLEIGGINLSYALLDYADFENSELTETHFQHSCLNHADFENAILSYIQASPVCAINTSFKNARILDCYFMESNLSNSTFEDAKIRRTVFSGSLLSNTNFSKALELNDVELSAVMDIPELRE